MTDKIIYKGDNARFVFDKSNTTPSDDITKYEKDFFVSGQTKRKQTMFFKNAPRLISGSAVVTKREAEGPLKDIFKHIIDDEKLGEKSFEKAEIRMLKHAVLSAVEDGGLDIKNVDLFLAGDLINQITTSSYTARDLHLPYMGLYSACSTMTQALSVGAMMIDAGHFNTIACATASHFATAERQYRYPLEYGSQRPPYSQWTVSGAGCSILSASGDGPKITSATVGRVTDFGICDIANMGAAMAPAAMNTLCTLLKETNTTVDDYDLILTGDLGKLGSDILRDLMHDKGHSLGQQYNDCGCIIYDINQNCYQGGSGAGCSASVFNAYILDHINKGYYNKVAFLATGALMNTQSCYQGETIPCISHAVVIER